MSRFDIFRRILDFERTMIPISIPILIAIVKEKTASISWVGIGIGIAFTMIFFPWY